MADDATAAMLDEMSLQLGGVLRLLEDGGWQPLGPGADRHGSWEWAFHATLADCIAA
jgi:hypothetical protein